MSRNDSESIPAIMSDGGRPAGSRREIKIIDTTLRDGHQSLWATRMRTDHILSMIDDFDRAGFDQVDLAAPIQFDVAVRYLKEDPWERVRATHAAAPNTRLRALIRSRNIAAFDFLPDDVIMAWVDRLFANGFSVIGSFDGLNDIGNIAPGLRHAKEIGASTFGAVSYSLSPVHTDELFVRTAVDLIEQADVDAIMLKDAGGLLTPDRIRTLVPALKEVIGDRPLEIHTHSLTGLAPLVCLEAVELGADALHLSVAPLSAANGQPSVQTVVRDLRTLGYVVNVDDARIDAISDRIEEIAETEDKPRGVPIEFNGLHFMHQTPGGMLSNFRSQLATAGLGDRYDELLLEVARVRSELAYPIMITPFAQFVGTQAVMNVMADERYAVVPNEIKKYALGYYGKLLAPIDPDVLEKIIANGASDISADIPDIPPMLPDLRRRHPTESIDDLLLRAMFAGTQVDEMKRTVASGGNPDEIPRPVLGLVKALHAMSATGLHSLSAGDLTISLTKGVDDNAA
ncbi:carboxylase [Cnuibacter physcomitrellae]|uniref:Pyruvate carboxylase n=1 Tax=Cnuibacter physcomitrellae TaxID=1619308 RepID=A0A1X9LR87_9MICO|nr:pyruvate carboxylase subunit B [Cnuibacter physcomitrellae]ARJ07693.1 pyruvate carboxylase [Cnuibacter physcomitrellae]GGI42584.1 carboxylase [Cnuibacter physcomitrellae]